MAGSPDPLSSVLAHMDLHCKLKGPARFCAPWSLSSNGPRPIRFYVVLQGHCWLQSSDLSAPLRLSRGDLLFAASDLGHRLCDDPKTPARRVRPSGSSRSGPATLLLRGEMHLPVERLGPLLSSLPPALHLRSGGHSSVSWLALAFGALAGAPLEASGAQRTADVLAEILLAHVIRTHLKTEPTSGVTPIGALVDPSLGPILEIMHARPGEPWTVAGLARAGGLSRSLFAARFAAAMKMPPMRYLQECRMRAAAGSLREERLSVKEIARRTGYCSEAAFSSAFKRWSGRPPSSFRGQS